MKATDVIIMNTEDVDVIIALTHLSVNEDICIQFSRSHAP
jgi:2',3'-cyclic-nucleotide 2'-phosphodiesterase (5'-nucleotidase family)